MMKSKWVLYGIFLITIFTIHYVGAKNQGLQGRIIYLDPGHGGKDPGTVYKDIHEADINLKIAQKLKQELEKEGVTVYLTRYEDYDLSVPNAQNRKRSDLSRRGNLINQSDCDLYLSIHLNAGSSSTWSGAQVFYDDVKEENKKLAENLQKQLSKDLKSKKKATLTNEMYLHKRVQKPGVLIEAGFLSNPNERYLLQKEWYQEKIAKSIVIGLKQYYT